MVADVVCLYFCLVHTSSFISLQLYIHWIFLLTAIYFFTSFLILTVDRQLSHSVCCCISTRSSSIFIFFVLSKVDNCASVFILIFCLLRNDYFIRIRWRRSMSLCQVYKWMFSKGSHGTNTSFWYVLLWYWDCWDQCIVLHYIQSVFDNIPFCISMNCSVPHGISTLHCI